MPFDEYEQTIEVRPNQVTEINYQFKKSKDYLIPATAIGMIIVGLSLISP